MEYSAFLSLGSYLQQNGIPKEILEQAQKENHFFTPQNVERAVAAICSSMLDAERLKEWIPEGRLNYPRVAIIMAGNIPLVGFFDLLCCAVCGAMVYIKPSSKDRVLMSWIVKKLQSFGADRLFFWNEESEVDAVIATGSNNANRYFEHRFGHLPSVRRGNRSSVAIIKGDETPEEIDALWHDIFDYFGLGCRSVSHLFIPQGYDIEPLLNRLSKKKIENRHYLNAYKQTRALKIMSNDPFFDGHFFVASQSNSLTASLGEITYSYFDEKIVSEHRDSFQCVVGRDEIPFGESQLPTLNDWADNVNLFDFLLQDLRKI